MRVFRIRWGKGTKSLQRFFPPPARPALSPWRLFLLEVGWMAEGSEDLRWLHREKLKESLGINSRRQQPHLEDLPITPRSCPCQCTQSGSDSSLRRMVVTWVRRGGRAWVAGLGSRILPCWEARLYCQLGLDCRRACTRDPALKG